MLPDDKSTIHEGDKIMIEFYNNSQLIGSTSMIWYERQTYERCLRNAGFSRITFHTTFVEKEGMQLYGEDYWNTWLQPPKNVVIEAIK